MTPLELQAIEARLKQRGYKMYTTSLTSTESWAWFKTFDKEIDDDENTTNGYQIAFRVWDNTKYGLSGIESYGLDFWASPLGTAFRTDLSSNWEPLASIAAFEQIAREFNALIRQHMPKQHNGNN